MKLDLVFVGTGAADWPVEPASGDWAQHRSSASLLVDGHLLLDCGPGVPSTLTRCGISPAAITDVLITHSHGDHLDLSSLRVVAAAGGRQSRMTVHCDPVVAAELASEPSFAAQPLECFRTYTLDAISVTPLPANHETGKPGEKALHFLLEAETTRLLYATDGAWLPRPTWQYLRGSSPLDAIVWDATIGLVDGDCRIFEHNSVAMIRLMRQSLISHRVIESDTPIYLTHLARTLCPPHEAFAVQLAPEGLTVAFDGMHLSAE